MTHNLKSDGPGLFKTKKLKMKNSTSLLTVTYPTISRSKV